MTVRPILVRVGFSVLVVLPWILLSTIQVSSKSEGRWYKGNLHTHTINSDGDSSPDVVARWYKENRYNFLVLSDHNYLTDPKGLKLDLRCRGTVFLPLVSIILAYLGRRGHFRV